MLAQRLKLSCSWNTYSLARIKVSMMILILMGNVSMMVAVMIVHLQATLGTIKLDQDSLDSRGLIGLPNIPACVPPLLGCYHGTCVSLCRA